MEGMFLVLAFHLYLGRGIQETGSLTHSFISYVILNSETVLSNFIKKKTLTCQKSLKINFYKNMTKICKYYHLLQKCLQEFIHKRYTVCNTLCSRMIKRFRYIEVQNIHKMGPTGTPGPHFNHEEI